MDGTLARGESLLSGVPEFLRAASHAKKRLVVLTDNSTRPRDEIAERLRSTGIPFNADQVVTSSHAAAVELYRLLGSCRVYLIGEKALADDLTQLGHEVVTTAPADAVVVGFTSRFDYTSLAKALPILASGAPLIVTDEAPVYAAPQGTMPGAGSLVGAFRGMGYAPVVVAGKPHGAAVDLALKATGTPRDKVALIGDSLPSDGGAAQHLGVSFVLVLTGVSTAEDAILAAGPPDHVCATLADASSRNAR
ncbi:HAD-IIA family hydrolase [Candidatus Bipolaricaulota bacterium]|nr:HAD-IIA family hydrolase [Candidatus Bipolaricaulota bacterium]